MDSDFQGTLHLHTLSFQVLHLAPTGFTTKPMHAIYDTLLLLRNAVHII
jgi:hypothetical protein